MKDKVKGYKFFKYQSKIYEVVYMDYPLNISMVAQYGQPNIIIINNNISEPEKQKALHRAINKRGLQCYRFTSKGKLIKRSIQIKG